MFRKKGPSDVEIAKENEIKLAITQELSKALKDVQKENVGTEDQAVYSTETANAVCTCLEAILLHGLKANAMKKLANYMGMGQQALSQPSLNFWTFAAKFTHGEVVSQLKHLGQITTEIGLCRAWVRVALNDGLMESYIDSMVADKRTLDYYYHRTAYLRDSEQPEIMKLLLHGLMTFEFKLSYNASVLNQWSYRPLIMSGVIDPKEAPPPIIKPVIKPQGSISDTDQRKRLEKRKSKQKNRRSENPMEQKPFGQPSDDTYYVTSSEFTSKDVENFKRLGRNSGSPVARSECSSSSRVSCPDPPKMNVSPANYVQHRPSFRSNESQSENSIDNQSDNPEGFDQPVSTMYDETFVGSPAVTGAGSFLSMEKDSLNIGKSEPLSADKLGECNEDMSDMNVGPDLDKGLSDDIICGIKLPPVSQPPEELLDDIYSELNPDDGKAIDTEIDDSHTGARNDLEESWEDFYRSPDKPVSVPETGGHKKFQRLESFTQDMKEKAILSDFDINDMLHESEKTKDSVKDNLTFENICEIEKPQIQSVPHVALEETQDKGTLQEVNVNEKKEEIQKFTTDKSVPVESSTAAISEIIIDRQVEAILKDGITSTSSPLTESNLKLLEEELSSYVEEKVKVDEEEESREIAHHLVSPARKKKKDKSSAALNKLKPPVSLSPPRQGALTPELSNAVADEISTIPMSNDKDYLKKHRLSLPAVSAVQSEARQEHRQSLPNLAEGIEDDLLREIYDGKPLDKENSENQDRTDDVMDEKEERIRRDMLNDEPRQSLGNSLMSGRGWSSSFDSELGDSVDALSSPKVPGSLPIRPKAESFGTLLQNYTPASSIGARSIDDILQNFPQSTSSVTMSPQSTGVSPPHEEDDNFDDFEVVKDTENFDSEHMDRLTQLAEIVNEKGLDAQNFQCKGCQRAVGMIFGKPRVCKFDGGYYCYECHENDESYIPALIVHNWDFRKHKVAKKNLEFIQEVEEQPCINLEISNPRLYEHVTEMQDIKMLRTQLLYLKSYLFSCKQSVAEDLRRLVWPRDYLFENIEEYSLADLLQVPTGALASSIKKVLRFCTKHVYSCRLCSQKGFICELCHSSKVIYPFEMESTYRCPTCKSVFHKDCKTDNRPCPKCQRRLRRESAHGIVETPTAVDYAFVSS